MFAGMLGKLFTLAMVYLLENMKRSLSRRAVSALFVGMNLREKDLFQLITATTQEKFEGFCAMGATLESGSSKMM